MSSVAQNKLVFGTLFYFTIKIVLVWFSSLFDRILRAIFFYLSTSIKSSIFDLVLITSAVSALLEASLDPMLVLLRNIIQNFKSIS